MLVEILYFPDLHGCTKKLSYALENWNIIEYGFHAIEMLSSILWVNSFVFLKAKAKSDKKRREMEESFWKQAHASRQEVGICDYVCYKRSKSYSVTI